MQARRKDVNTLLTEQMKKCSERRKHCARTGCSKVRTPPADPPQTHRQDRLQYTAPLASTQCDKDLSGTGDKDKCNDQKIFKHKVSTYPINFMRICRKLFLSFLADTQTHKGEQSTR